MQCCVKGNTASFFQYEKHPELLYVTKADAELTKMPCIMHMPEDHLEILFIREGKGIHTIGGKRYHTKKGDILIYNSRVLHDERTTLDAQMSVYCCAISNLKIEGSRENCLLPDGVSPVLHSGVFFEDIESIFRIMHSQLYSQNIGAENISQHMLYSLIYLILNQLDKPKKRDEVSDYFIGNRKKNI